MPSAQLKHALGGHQGECHFISFCDVNTPDLAVEKALQYTARMQAAHRSQSNSVCTIKNEEERSDIVSRAERISDSFPKSEAPKNRLVYPDIFQF